MTEPSSETSGSPVATNYFERIQVLSKGPKAHLAWLIVHSFEELREQRIEFDAGINVILGRNGAGKTTLLEILARIITADFSTWSDREFDVEYQYELGQWSWHFRVKNLRNVERRAENDRPFQPIISLRARFEEFDLTADVESNRVRWSDGVHSTVHDFEQRLCVIFLTGLRLGTDAEAQWSHCWQMAMAPLRFSLLVRRFDEGLELFNAVVAGISPQEPYSIFVDAKGDLSMEYSTSSRMLRSLSSLAIDWKSLVANPTNAAILRADQLGISAEIVRGLGALDVFASLGQPEIVHSGERTTLRFSSLKFFMTRANGDQLPHHSWSWGQRRLVAFALYLAANRTAVVADELVNGMHHEWIELCLREMGDRQVFVSSQNPIRVDLVPLHSVQQIQRSFVLCEAVQTGPNRTERRWKNLDQHSAEELFELRSTSLQSTSEIMRFKGWW